MPTATSSGFIVLAFTDFTYEVRAGGVIPDIPMKPIAGDISKECDRGGLPSSTT